MHCPPIYNSNLVSYPSNNEAIVTVEEALGQEKVGITS